MDDGKNSDLVPVYIGSSRPDILQFETGELETGLPYRFTTQAININGNSSPSAIATYYSCAPPKHLSTPLYLSSSLTEITIGWQMPSYDGGCPILGYKIFMVSDTTTTEVLSQDEPDL